MKVCKFHFQIPHTKLRLWTQSFIAVLCYAYRSCSLFVEFLALIKSLAWLFSLNKIMLTQLLEKWLAAAFSRPAIWSAMFKVMHLTDLSCFFSRHKHEDLKCRTPLLRLVDLLYNKLCDLLQDLLIVACNLLWICVVDLLCDKLSNLL